MDGFIDANTKVLVKRTPLIIDNPIQFTYTPIEAGNNSGQKRSGYGDLKNPEDEKKGEQQESASHEESSKDRSADVNNNLKF